MIDGGNARVREDMDMVDTSGGENVCDQIMVKRCCTIPFSVSEAEAVARKQLESCKNHGISSEAAGSEDISPQDSHVHGPGDSSQILLNQNSTARLTTFGSAGRLTSWRRSGVKSSLTQQYA
jgi:hypothetical protein